MSGFKTLARYKSKQTNGTVFPWLAHQTSIFPSYSISPIVFLSPAPNFVNTYTLRTLIKNSTALLPASLEQLPQEVICYLGPRWHWHRHGHTLSLAHTHLYRDFFQELGCSSVPPWQKKIWGKKKRWNPRHGNELIPEFMCKHIILGLKMCTFPQLMCHICTKHHFAFKCAHCKVT